MIRNAFTAVTLATALLAAACGGEEADPSTVQTRLDATLPGLVDSTLASTGFVADSALLAQLSDGFAALDTTFAALPFAGDEEPLPAELDDDGELSGQELVDFLVENVFTEEAYEGDGVYLLGPELLCPTDFDGAIDPECADLVTQAELRIRVALAGDGLDFTLLVGPDRAAPLALELRTDRASLVGDLAEAAAAAEHLASITDGELELPDVLEGVVALSLIVHGAEDVSVELAVRQPIRVEGSFPEVGMVAFSTAAADPLASLRFDGPNQRLTAAYDLGRTRLQAPYSAIDPLSLASGTFDLDLQGASATLVLEDALEALVVANIGFGDGTSTISLDEFELVALDFNAEAGRRMALTIAPTDALPSFTFDPELDLALAIDLTPLADAGDDVPSYLLEEQYTVTADGSMPTLQPVLAADGTSGGLRVASGNLRIASATDEVVVPTGACLLADELAPGEHEILGYLASGDCP